MEAERHRIPTPLPVTENLNPQLQDNYPGNKLIPAKVTYVPVEYEGHIKTEEAVICLADMWIDPQRPDPYVMPELYQFAKMYKPQNLSELPKFYELRPATPKRPKATVLYMGGGGSQALGSTGLAGYMRDAQIANRTLGETPQWDIANVITISHPNHAPRSEEKVDTDSMKPSAEIVYKAIQQAYKNGSIHLEDNIVLMGASAGGAVVTELAALMTDHGTPPQFLILEEPAGMGEHPYIVLNAIINPILAAIKHKRSIPDEILLSMGARSFAELINRYLSEMRPSRKKDKFKHLTELFRIDDGTEKAGLNAALLGHDTTKAARENINCPVLYIASIQGTVVNPFEAHLGYSRSKLARIGYNETILYEATSNIMGSLFPESKQRTFLVVPGYDHSGLGRNEEVWKKMLSVVQRTQLES